MKTIRFFHFPIFFLHLDCLSDQNRIITNSQCSLTALTKETQSINTNSYELISSYQMIILDRVETRCLLD